ncbi:MAG: DegT/DnrJ/EryC1/StrS family aminotransferase [bacterium]|nr:DegT/DnrJ/EryC1/StrS family aminotransferase [bacterium]
MKKRSEFIALTKPRITDDEISAVVKVMKSGWWTTGPETSAFEKEMVEYLGGGLNAVGLNSCTSGLFLALKALDVGYGDEVIVPTMTYVATAHVVEWCGATPILCDIDPLTRNLDLDDCAKKITPRTKVIIPVHIAGLPVDLKNLNILASKHNITIIEDAAHAVGSSYQGQKIGHHSLASIFSFYATKNLACGEGGMLVTSDEEFAEKIRRLSYFGIDKQAFQRHTKKGSWYYQVEGPGFKCNLDNIHAAIGRIQLRKLDDFIDKRQRIAAWYDELLPESIQRPIRNSESSHCFHLYQLGLPEEWKRDALVSYLKDWNVGCSVHFIPLHEHPHYRRNKNEFAGCNRISHRNLSLPMDPGLTVDDVKYISRVIENFGEKL